jgi:hypothetical protein
LARRHEGERRELEYAIAFGGGEGGGKKSFNNDGKTPLRRFENGDSRRRWRLSDEEKEEIIALLGGPYSEANND